MNNFINGFSNLQIMFMIYLITTLALLSIIVITFANYRKLYKIQLYLDPLTQVYNHRYFDEIYFPQLKHKKFADSNICLMMIDIDEFKNVNHTYGHTMGDTCLKEIAQAIKNVLKIPPDVIIRYGGEEFLVCVLVPSEFDAREYVDFIMESVRNTSIGPKIHVTASLGACLIKQSDLAHTDVDHIIKIANNNLYHAKRIGKNQAIFNIF